MDRGGWRCLDVRVRVDSPAVLMEAQAQIIKRLWQRLGESPLWGEITVGTGSGSVGFLIILAELFSKFVHLNE